jgi:subtilisin family serine protease
MKARLLLLFAAPLALPLFAYSSTWAYHQHRLDGSPLEFQVADTLVSLLFAPSAATIDSSAFARERPELRDDSPVRNVGGGIFVFAVTPGWTTATVIGNLRTDSRVRMVNPVFCDGQGHLSYMSDQVIVRFRDGTPKAQIDSINAALASYVNPPDPDEPLEYFVQARSDFHLSALDVAEMYYQSGLCLYAEPNLVWRPILDQAHGTRIVLDTSLSPPDTFYRFQWHWRNVGQAGGGSSSDADVDADSAWMVTLGDSTARVAFIDYGFDIHHEDKDSLTRVFGYDLFGNYYPFFTPDSEPKADCTIDQGVCAHGTACLGELAAAHSNHLGLKGLAPHCTYWAIKFADDAMFTNDSMIKRSLHAAWATLGCQVVSNSWHSVLYRPGIEKELDTMYKSGVTVFFASGNEGNVEFPAYLPSVTAVGATDQFDSVWSWSGKGDSLDIVAPGGNTDHTQPYGYIWTEDVMGADGYVPFLLPAATCANNSNYMCRFGGTSSAAPIAAGIAALVYSRRPDFKDSTARVELIRRILDSSAEHIPTGGFDTTYGHGRVNAYRALLSVIRGDFDNSGRIDSLDVFGMRDYCFKVLSPPTLDKRVADTDGDGDADICDYLRTLAAKQAGTGIAPCFAF